MDSCTKGQIAIGYSGLYYVDKQIQRDCVVYELVVRRSTNLSRVKYASKIVSSRLGVGQISSSLIEPLDLTKDSSIDQRVKLLTPLVLHAGDYIGFSSDIDRIVNPDATAGDSDIAYTSTNEEPVEFTGNLLKNDYFAQGTKVYEAQYASYFKLYGFYN